MTREALAQLGPTPDPTVAGRLRWRHGEGAVVAITRAVLFGVGG